ncbi:hypothetical protein LINPERHAP2_LOCUS10746 [Linum perenne]
MLSCGSKVSVTRIIALNGWRFEVIWIQLDAWIPEAGRSNVLLVEDKVWVTVRSLPLHLKSVELLK